ncbi:MAG: AMP-binding protein [Rhodospirillales bacterium]
MIEDRAAFVAFPRDALDRTIPERFAVIVAAHADRIALVMDDDVLTYDALDRWSDRVAQCVLARCSAGAQRIGLLAAQSPFLVAAILGILKAGRIYVPLDATLPAAATAAVAADAGLALTVADTRNAAAAHALGLPVLDAAAVDAAPDRPVGVRGGADDDAYVYYTSGSTGRPKGVVDTHRNVLHNILRYTNTLRIAPDDRLSLLQDVSFSGAVSSLLAALLNGATVCPWDMRRRGLAGMAEWISRTGVTVFHSVPQIFRRVAAAADVLPTLRVVRLEGDQAFAGDARLFQAKCAGGSVLVNGLGATECGLVRQYFVTGASAVADGPLPIGYPVEDMAVLLLDEAGAVQPPGAIGEIAVRSRYLARGYWADPARTAAAFVPEPSAPELRTYRTGDMGVMRADGCLVHLGRRDFQHKIAGRHVDIASVEAAILALGVAREVAVRTHAEDGEEPVLAAHLVPVREPVDPLVLRRTLRATLPDHAIPTAIVTRPAMPLDANGKVDRKALALPAADRADPRGTPLEAAVAGLWAAALGVSPVSREVDFVTLGGTAAQARTLVAAVEMVFGLILIPDDIMATGMTVALMAGRLGRRIQSR